MNPFTAMLTVLGTLAKGEEVVARTPAGAELSSLKGDGPCWQQEAEMVADGHAPIGAQDPTIRRIVLPLVRANRILGDETNRRRFAQAREVVSRCEAPDWREQCLQWIDAMEKGLETQ